MCFFTEPYMGAAQQEGGSAADFANFPLDLTEEQVREFLMLQDGASANPFDFMKPATETAPSPAPFFPGQTIGATSDHFPVQMPRGAVYSVEKKQQARVAGVKRFAEEVDEEEQVEAVPSAAPKVKRSRKTGGGRGGPKKPRFTWSRELCAVFDYAMSVLDEDLQTPKNIMQVMRSRTSDIPEDFRTDHIKSHLQKWRLARRKGHTLHCRGAPAAVPRQQRNGGEDAEQQQQDQPQQQARDTDNVHMKQEPNAMGALKQDGMSGVQPSTQGDEHCPWPPVDSGYPEDLAEVPLQGSHPSFATFPAMSPQGFLTDEALELGGLFDSDELDYCPSLGMPSPAVAAFGGAASPGMSSSPASAGVMTMSSASSSHSNTHSTMMHPSSNNSVSSPCSSASAPKTAEENPLKWLLMGYQMGFQNGCTQFGSSSAHSQVPSFYMPSEQ